MSRYTAIGLWTAAAAGVVVILGVAVFGGWKPALELGLILSFPVTLGASLILLRRLLNLRRALIVTAVLGLIPSVIFATRFMNSIVIEALGWDSDGYLGFYLFLWWPTVVVFDLGVVGLVGIATRSTRASATPHT